MAFAAHPEFACREGLPRVSRTMNDIEDDVLCAGNDDAIRFMEQVYDEVCALFPGEYIHIGGDECPKKRWKECPKSQARIKALGLKDEDGLQAWVTFNRPSSATQPRANHNHPSCRIQERFRHNHPTSTILESTTLSCMALARPSTASAVASLPTPPATRRRSPYWLVSTKSCCECKIWSLL